MFGIGKRVDPCSLFKSNYSYQIAGWTDNVVSEGTIHHNWFVGSNQRNPSADNLLHFQLFINYFSGVTSYRYYARCSTNVLIKYISFESTNDRITINGRGSLTGNIVDGASSDEAPDQVASFYPAEFYSYTPDAAEEVPSIVQGSACPPANSASKPSGFCRLDRRHLS